MADHLTFTAGEIASITGGQLQGDPAVTIRSITTDSRDVPPGALFIPLPGERFDGHDYILQAVAGGAGGYLSAGAGAPPAPFVIRVPDTLAAYQAIARAWRRRVAPRVVAVTGSAGKTTTKEMAAALIGGHLRTLKSEANYNNEVGVPLTLLRLEPGHQAAVVELAMRSRGEIGQLARLAEPDVAIITNVGLAHVELLGSREAIAAAKCEVLAGLRPGGWLLIRAEDEEVCRPHLGGLPPDRLVRFSADPGWPAEVRALTRRRERDRTVIEAEIARPVARRITVTTPLAGEHQAANALAVVAAALCLGLDLPDEVAVEPAALPGRARWRDVGPWRVFDDSYNANPEAMRAAYAGFAEEARDRQVLLLGEMLELGPLAEREHHDLGRWLACRLPPAALLATVGPMAAHIGAGARAGGVSAERLLDFPSNDAAADALPARLAPGDAIFVKGSRGARLDEVIAQWVAGNGLRATPQANC